MKHTPGPWSIGKTLYTKETARWSLIRVEENDEIEKQMVFSDFSALDDGKNRKCVSNCCVPVFTIEECQANARLIAAAPDMYEALTECANNLKFLSNHLTGRMGEGALAEIERLADEAFLVLAKAEGKV